MNKFIFLTPIILIIVSCGASSFHKRKYKRGFEYGHKNRALSYESNDTIQPKHKAEGETIELTGNIDTVGTNYNETAILEASTSESIIQSNERLEYNKQIKIKEIASNHKENKDDDLLDYQERIEKKGKRLILIGGLWMLYIPIVGVMAIIAITTLNSSAMFILTNIFLLCLVTLSIFMAWTKRFVKNTERNKSRLAILIVNLVVGVAAFLLMAYHAIADSI